MPETEKLLDTAKLQRLAHRNGITTRYQLAKAIPCSESQAQRFWEGTTDPKLSSLIRLCEVLNCEIPDIVKRARRKAATAK